MTRVPHLAALLALLAPALARAQIVEVELKSKGAARAQKSYLLERDGHPVLRGEPRYRLEYAPDGTIAWSQWGFELFVGDPDEPEEVPYTWRAGEREPRSKARLAELASEDIVRIRMVAPDLTLGNLATEVRERRANIATLERSRSKAPEGSDAYFDDLYLRLESQRRLQILLEHHGFEPAARRLDDAVRKLSGAAGSAVRWKRGQEALASIRVVETPVRLAEAAQRISGGAERFTVHQSRHLRVVHDQGMDERRARALLALGEEVIEGFRREIVDPFDRLDRIPERPFSEFWFGPSGDEHYGRYFEEYYRLSWGTPEEKARALERRGKYRFLRAAPEYLSYFRGAPEDAEDLLVHRIGEQLAEIHFEEFLEHPTPTGQAWMSEAFGLHASLEHFGASTASCVSSAQVTASKDQSRRRAWNERPTAYYQSLASESKKPLEVLVLRGLAELGREDVAKGWSVLQYFLGDGTRGQDALHSVAHLAREPGTLLERWREELRVLYDVADGDPLDVLEKRWRAALPGEER